MLKKPRRAKFSRKGNQEPRICEPMITTMIKLFCNSTDHDWFLRHFYCIVRNE
jgi:hypothetical protein